jgi:hypothetical protein
MDYGIRVGLTVAIYTLPDVRELMCTARRDDFILLGISYRKKEVDWRGVKLNDGRPGWVLLVELVR